MQTKNDPPKNISYSKTILFFNVSIKLLMYTSYWPLQ